METGAKSAVVDLWKREDGVLSSRCFARRVGGSEALIMRLRNDKRLDKHGGCVNTLSFNSDGTILASGSDDRQIILWDWDAGTVKHQFHSGHSNNVFQARFMPFTDDRVMVTCAADGEVRQLKILEGGKVRTTLLGVHEGRAHKLAIEPGSPYIFYSCGEDGLVQHFDLRSKTPTKLLTCKNNQTSIIHLNAITIDPTDPNLFVVGGTDEYACMYDIRRYKWDGSTDIGRPVNLFCPAHLLGEDHLGITGLAFSHHGELLTSYNDENIYLFQKGQGLGPDSWLGPNREGSDPDSEGPRVFEGHRNCDTVKGVSFFGPNCEYVASGSDCGRLFIWRKSDAKLLRAIDGDRYVVNCIESHPYATVIASSGIDNDIKMWIPNSTEPASPVNISELKHKRRNRFWRFALPEDLIAQVLAMRRQRRDDDEFEPSNSDLINLIVQMANGDDVSDENSGQSSEGPGDCRVN
ncbi:DDB1- and CUL4-associated factor 8 isoform X2 [Carex littledalei]|uniref:DDB1- and CUL4-associated factor 8 isoform X2 n=1 Tax=Carex littledalei TaxID=544730 RepID=A0A833QM41_9POAL|nr:DDB1- and CUL4-associated factor 8 isoform X2 [Carex littledalei]